MAIDKVIIGDAADGVYFTLMAGEKEVCQIWHSQEETHEHLVEELFNKLGFEAEWEEVY